MAADKAATAVVDTTTSKAVVPTEVVKVATNKVVSKAATVGRQLHAVCRPVHRGEQRMTELRRRSVPDYSVKGATAC